MKQTKTVKMKFSKDMFYNDLDNPLYLAGKTYDVPENMVERWVKRGGDIVGDETTIVEPEAPAPVEAETPAIPEEKKEEENEEVPEPKEEKPKFVNRGNRGSR